VLWRRLRCATGLPGVCENQVLTGRVEDALSTVRQIADHEEHDEALGEVLSRCLERNAQSHATAWLVEC